MPTLTTLFLNKPFVNYSNLLTITAVYQNVKRVYVSIEYLFQCLFWRELAELAVMLWPHSLSETNRILCYTYENVRCDFTWEIKCYNDSLLQNRGFLCDFCHNCVVVP